MKTFWRMRSINFFRKRFLVGFCALLPLGVALAREVPLTLLCTTDLHGRVLPSWDAPPGEAGSSLLRCATVIESVRSNRPNVLLFDCGDTLQGTPESLLTEGQIMIEAMRALRYDAWVLGNHEFDWGLSPLRAAVKASRAPVLAANLRAKPGRPDPVPGVEPFVVRTVDGVRVGVVGLTTPGIPSWTRPEMLEDALFDASIETLAQLMPRVREAEPDVLVLLVHQGLQPGADDFANEVNTILRRFPEFDVVFGGHLHVEIPGMERGDTLFVQAGCHGRGVGCAELVYDTVEKRVTDRKGSVLSALDAEEWAPLKTQLKPQLDRARAYLDEVVAFLPEPLSPEPDRNGCSPMQQLLGEAVAKAVGAEAALHGTFTKETLPAGPVTRRDIWRMVPYENRIGVLHLTPRELAEVLDEDAAGNRPRMGLWGLDADRRAAKDDLRIREPSGDFVHPRKRVPVAFNSYVLASGGRRYPRLRALTEEPIARFELHALDTREAVTRLLKQRFPPGEGHDRSATDPAS